MRTYEIYLCGISRLTESCGTSFIKIPIRANYLLEAKFKAIKECEKILTKVRVIECKEIAA